MWWASAVDQVRIRGIAKARKALAIKKWCFTLEMKEIDKLSKKKDIFNVFSLRLCRFDGKSKVK